MRAYANRGLMTNCLNAAACMPGCTARSSVTTTGNAIPFFKFPELLLQKNDAEDTGGDEVAGKPREFAAADDLHQQFQ